MTRMSKDEDRGKGAVEQESREQDGNTSLAGQLGHRNQDPLIKAHDTDYPEPGESAQHSGAHSAKSQGEDPRQSDAGEQAEEVDQDPGERQKRNQNQEKDDPLAA